MTTTSENSNIIKFKKRKQLNIGIVIFGIIFIYLIATIFMYITAPRTTVYEVRQGSILKDYAYTGLALREETVVYAEKNGYVNSYAQESSKVRVGSKIYVLSDQELDFTSSEDEVLELTSALEDSIVVDIQKHNKNFNSNNFEETYALKNSIDNKLNDLSSESKSNQIDALVNQNRSDVTVYQTRDDGIVTFMQPNNTKVKNGDAIYKIITDDHWKLEIELLQETADVLADKKYIKVKVTKDNQEMWAGLSIEKKDGKNVAYLSFQDAMVRYAADQYLDIELILEDETGLKIPKSAETEKEFYKVPRAYITQGGNSSNDIVLLQSVNEKGETVTILEEVNVYYEEDEFVYLDTNAFKKDQVLRMPDSNDTFMLSETKTLKGVFCINKGYAVFKQIHILCESDAYYIVEEGNAYGLSNYDHIALDSSNISENDVVF